MNVRRLLIFVAIVGGALTGPHVFAWNKAAHMVSGAIAYDDLKSAGDTRVIAEVTATLKRHPYYRTWIEDLRSPTGAGPAQHDLVLFMAATTWPDDIRGISRYECSECHYINYPYTPPGTPDWVHPAPPRATNIVTAFAVNRAVLGRAGNGRDKSIALCWVAHLVGDVHVPLHTTALFSADYPAGDRGGNLIFIKPSPGPIAENLHAYWDGIVTRDAHWRRAKLIGQKLRATPGLRRRDLPELRTTSFKAWSHESAELAKSAVYLYGQLPMATSWLDAKVLPREYVANARQVGERRLALAGYRLADVLREVYGKRR